MSWSVAGLGKAGAVKAKVADEFARIASPAYNMDAAEKAVAGRVGDAIAALLEDQSPTSVVEVSASGSMSGGVSTPPLNITVSTKWNFIE